MSIISDWKTFISITIRHPQVDRQDL